MQPACADILCAVIDLVRHSGYFGHRIILKHDIDAFGSQQSDILK